VIGSSPPDGVYGDPAPPIAPSYVGFVGCANASSLTTAPACSATYTHTASSGPGSYSTSCSGGVSADYSFTYVNGTFRVGKAPLVVTVSSPADGVYGDVVPTITASYQTFVYDHESAFDNAKALVAVRPVIRGRAPLMSRRSELRSMSRYSPAARCDGPTARAVL